MNNKLWYAVQTDPNDDWGTGSFNRDEAVEMLKWLQKDYPDALIAVIENDVCIEEIRIWNLKGDGKMKYVTINNEIVGVTKSSDIFDACEELDIMSDYDKADLSLAHQLDTDQILKFLDDVPDWNSDGVEELMREMCDRLNICFDAYETYDDLYEEIMKGGSKK